MGNNEVKKSKAKPAEVEVPPTLMPAVIVPPAPVVATVPADPNVTIRVHVDEDTIDIPWLASTAHSVAETFAQRGVWTVNRKKFYPAKNIIYIEVI